MPKGRFSGRLNWRQDVAVIAALLAPLLPCLFAALFVALRAGDIGDGGAVAITLNTLRYAVVAYSAAFVFGLPVYSVYRLLARGPRLSVMRVTLLGALLGALSGVLLQQLLSAEHARSLFSGLYPPALEYAMFGAMTALGFWWLVKKALRKQAIESQDQQELNTK